MALSGLRDMSTLEQPPVNRQPVQTYVIEHDWGLLADAMRRELDRGGYDRDRLVGRIHAQVKRLLDLGTDCGFDCDLWQCYLTWLLMTNENSFTRTCERTGVQEGSVNHFARGDFAVFHRLFHYDFGPVEQALGIDCFCSFCCYRAIP